MLKNKIKYLEVYLTITLCRQETVKDEIKTAYKITHPSVICGEKEILTRNSKIKSLSIQLSRRSRQPQKFGNHNANQKSFLKN